MFNDKSNWVLQRKQGAREEMRTSANEVFSTPQPQKRVSEVSREWHCRNPLCYLRHLFLLPNTVKADTANWRWTRELLCQGEMQVDESAVSSPLTERNFGPQTCKPFPYRKHWRGFETQNVASPSQDTKLETGILILIMQYHSLKGKIHHILLAFKKYHPFTQNCIQVHGYNANSKNHQYKGPTAVIRCCPDHAQAFTVCPFRVIEKKRLELSS